MLSSLGVVLTTFFTGVFVHFIFRLGWLEALLIGAVVSSTDAASVFNILRSKNLALKNHTDSLLEIESGSNDPMSYMLTLLLSGLMVGEKVSIGMTLLLQISLGIGIGLLSGFIAIKVMDKCLDNDADRTILLLAVAIIAYALPTVVGGNGYLSVYLRGIYLGNKFISDKKGLVHFFDVVSEISQMNIFFLLGFLVTPSQLPELFIPAILIALCLIFISRPLSVLMIMAPFRADRCQIGIVSFAGLRGAASIVFAILVVLKEVHLTYNIFNLVFIIVLISLVLQGTLFPYVSNKLNMIDYEKNVLKTFTDYQDSSDISFIKVHVDESHQYAYKELKDVELPKEMLAVMILRDEGTILPNGSSVLFPGDLIVLAAQKFTNRSNMTLRESIITKNNKWNGMLIKDLPKDNHFLIIIIKREGETIIPKGDTMLVKGDVIVSAYFRCLFVL